MLEMFHPPKKPQRQLNSNITGLQWVPFANTLKFDVAPPAIDVSLTKKPSTGIA